MEQIESPYHELLHNSPFLFNASQKGLAFSCNSTPINRPRPRTFFRVINFCNSDLKYSPIHERPGKSSSNMTSNAAIETAQANGLPPNVEPCEPGVNTSSTSLSLRLQK